MIPFLNKIIFIGTERLELQQVFSEDTVQLTVAGVKRKKDRKRLGNEDREETLDPSGTGARRNLASHFEALNLGRDIALLARSPRRGSQCFQLNPTQLGCKWGDSQMGLSSSRGILEIQSCAPGIFPSPYGAEKYNIFENLESLG